MAQWDKIGHRGSVNDRRGMRSAGGGIGLVGIGLVLAVAYFGGGEQAAQVYDVLQQSESQHAQQTQEQLEEFAGEDRYELFASQVLGSTNALWQQKFDVMGSGYEDPTLVLFRGQTQSACGGATSAVGPHYCPLDQTIYLDETFFEELTQRFGARGGDVAEAYVIAHEVGHHVQNLKGTLSETRSAQTRSPGRANELSVRQELQADCYAGIWAHSLRDQHIFEEGEIAEAIDAAEAVGDDNIQERTRGHVDEDHWTHGSSQERRMWFLRGYEQGDVSACSF